MHNVAQYNHVQSLLSQAGLRPTRQRLLLGNLLFSPGLCRHVTAETLHREAKAANINVSLATIYNTLNQFTEVKLLSPVTVEGGRCYFDTNMSEHHHFFCEETGELIDIPGEEIKFNILPLAPIGSQVTSIKVFICMTKAAKEAA